MEYIHVTKDNQKKENGIESKLEYITTKTEVQNAPIPITIRALSCDRKKLSIEQINDTSFLKLDEADRLAENTTERLTHEEVFSKLRERIE